jgi:hypothetical protein
MSRIRDAAFKFSVVYVLFLWSDVITSQNGWTCSQAGHKKSLQRGTSKSRIDGVTEQRLEANHNVQERKFAVLDNFEAPMTMRRSELSLISFCVCKEKQGEIL